MRAALSAVCFVLCIPLICIVVVPVPFVCCSIKLPLSRPTSFCLFLSILLRTPAGRGAVTWRFCCQPQLNYNKESFRKLDVRMRNLWKIRFLIFYSLEYLDFLCLADLQILEFIMDKHIKYIFPRKNIFFEVFFTHHQAKAVLFLSYTTV